VTASVTVEGGAYNSRESVNSDGKCDFSPRYWTINEAYNAGRGYWPSGQTNGLAAVQLTYLPHRSVNKLFVRLYSNGNLLT